MLAFAYVLLGLLTLSSAWGIVQIARPVARSLRDQWQFRGYWD